MVHYFLLMAINMWVNGMMTKNMGKAHYIMLMAVNLRLYSLMKVNNAHFFELF